MSQSIHPGNLLKSGDYDLAYLAAEALVKQTDLSIDHFWAGITMLLVGEAGNGKQHLLTALRNNDDFAVSDFYCELSAERRAAAYAHDPGFDWLALQQGWALFRAQRV